MDDGVSGLKSERHMIVGIPKERRPYEYRVGLPPAGCLRLADTREDKLQLIAQKQLTALAYELVQEDSGERPIMAPLSQIGGRMAVQIAARLLQNDHGGRGILLGGLAGVPPAGVGVVGGGGGGRPAPGAPP